MKNLTEFIFEKLRISSKSKRTKTSLSEVDSNYHKYTITELKDILNQYPDYKVLIIGDDIRNSETLEYEICTSEQDFTSQPKNPYHVSYYKNLSSKCAICLFVRNKQCNPITAKTFLKYISETGKKICEIALMDVDDSNIKFLSWNSMSSYIVYNVEINQSQKNINIHIATDRNIKSLISKNKSEQVADDYEITRKANYFNKDNENDLIEDLNISDNETITKEDIINIPEKIKYKGKSGESNLFWKVYCTLAIYGDMSKTDIIETINMITGLNLMSTSYTTMFSNWRGENRLSVSKGKWHAEPYRNWKY